MKQLLILLIAAGLTLSACGGIPTPAATATPLPPAATPTPIPPTAVPTPGSPYADRVIAYERGPVQNGMWDQVGNDPGYVLGPPDAVVDPCCRGLLALGTGGSVTVEFTDNSIVNGLGPDLSITGDPQNDEHVRVEVSTDGVDWKDLGIAEEIAQLDLQPVGLQFAKYVRITDDAVVEGDSNNSAEVDAVEALHSGPPQ